MFGNTTLPTLDYPFYSTWTTQLFPFNCNFVRKKRKCP